ncbi:MAG: undecaprenyl-phosphate glucose phosphotransferase, partial [Gammaproteobacteria bacterium]
VSGLVQALFALFMLLAGAAFITKTGEAYSREWFGWWGLFAVLSLISCRGCLLLFLRLMRLYGWNERRVIVIGVGEMGIKLINTMQQSLWTGFRIIAIFDDAPEDKPSLIGGIKVERTPDDINHYIASMHGSIDEIWLAFPLREEVRAKALLYQLRHQPLTIRFALDILGVDFSQRSIAELAGFPVLNICTTPMVGMNRIVKAIEDRLLASFILLLISPLFILIALAVKMSSPGPIFYRQKRVGWSGKEFEMLKFRTMPVGAESNTGPVWAKEGENRATKVGAFLRRTSLDELPQFINVLFGDMSIVGPRPERMYFVEQFKEQIPRYMHKHLMKAGITGWAQVNGWRGNTSLEKRIEYDLYYIENWSLLFDVKIIFLTVFRGFVNKNAY